MHLFNAEEAPTKQAAFAQYKYPNASYRYAKIADYLGLGGNTNAEKVELLIKAVEELQAKVNMPKTIQEAGVSEVKFFETIDEMVEQAFDDQCTGANPRYPLMKELKEMYITSYYGRNAKNEAKAEAAPTKVEQAFDDQCTGANPRYPLMKELKEMYITSYYGRNAKNEAKAEAAPTKKEKKNK